MILNWFDDLRRARAAAEVKCERGRQGGGPATSFRHSDLPTRPIDPYLSATSKRVVGCP